MLLAFKGGGGGQKLQKRVLQDFLRVRHVVQITVGTAQNRVSVGVQRIRRHLVDAVACPGLLLFLGNQPHRKGIQPPKKPPPQGHGNCNCFHSKGSFLSKFRLGFRPASPPRRSAARRSYRHRTLPRRNTRRPSMLRCRSGRRFLCIGRCGRRRSALRW